MVRGAAEGRSSWACQGTLNGIPNAEWYVLALSFVRNHLIHSYPHPLPPHRKTETLYQVMPIGTWRRRGSFKLGVPGYAEWCTER